MCWEDGQLNKIGAPQQGIRVEWHSPLSPIHMFLLIHTPSKMFIPTGNIFSQREISQVSFKTRLTKVMCSPLYQINCISSVLISTATSSVSTGERNINWLLSHTCPNWGLNLQPGYVPWMGMEPATVWLWDDSLTEPHQPGLEYTSWWCRFDSLTQSPHFPSTVPSLPGLLYILGSIL